MNDFKFDGLVWAKLSHTSTPDIDDSLMSYSFTKKDLRMYEDFERQIIEDATQPLR